MTLKQLEKPTLKALPWMLLAAVVIAILTATTYPAFAVCFLLGAIVFFFAIVITFAVVQEKGRSAFTKNMQINDKAWFSSRDSSFHCVVKAIEGDVVIVEVRLKKTQLYPLDSETQSTALTC